METVNKVDKKPIAPILRDMEINYKEQFPIEQFSSIMTTISRIGKQYKRKFSTSTNEDNIWVTRIK